MYIHICLFVLFMYVCVDICKHNYLIKLNTIDKQRMVETITYIGLKTTYRMYPYEHFKIPIQFIVICTYIHLFKDVHNPV